MFPEDEQLFQLLEEQERVTSQYIVFAVHNKLNEELKIIFKKLSKKDKLYDVRFFTPEEIVDIIKDSRINYKEIKIYKFGGVPDVLYQKKIKMVPNILFKFSQKIVPFLYKYVPWKKVERILVVLRLDQ